jgi:signal transduction histidine kinase
MRRVDELMLSSSPLNERVRVRGVVTHAVPCCASPGTVEEAFLRISHEGVASAAKHSRSSKVRVRMTYGSAEVSEAFARFHFSLFGN